MLLAWGICQNEDLKSAVVVGLLHNSLKIIPHWRRMNFWLTVLTGISDPELVFGSHSSQVVMCVLIHKRPKDLTLADKVLKKTPLDLQKNVARYTMRVPNTWRPVVAARHSPRTAQHSARISDRWEKRWLTGNVGLSTAY